MAYTLRREAWMPKPCMYPGLWLSNYGLADLRIFSGSLIQWPLNNAALKYMYMCIHILLWVVVNIMALFGSLLYIVRHLLFWVPKRDPNFDNHPYIHIYIYIHTTSWNQWPLHLPTAAGCHCAHACARMVLVRVWETTPEYSSRSWKHTRVGTLGPKLRNVPLNRTKNIYRYVRAKVLTKFGRMDPWGMKGYSISLDGLMCINLESANRPPKPCKTYST